MNIGKQIADLRKQKGVSRDELGKEVARMTDKDKDYVYTLIDAFIAKNKLKGLV